MSQTPEEIRADIERTRQELGTDVDAVADKVNPSNIAHRQADKVKHSFSNVKESVMGKAEGVKDSVLGKAEDVKDNLHSRADNGRGNVQQAQHAVQNAPHQISDKAAGNPLAAGLIAFGAGLLVASLIPASSKERELTSQLKEQAAPLTDAVSDAAKNVVDEVREPAQQAFQSVKESATDSVETVKDEGQQAADDVKGSAKDAKDNVQQR